LKDKKKGPAAVKQTGPKCKDKSKHQLNSKPASKENQYIVLKFDRDHPNLPIVKVDAVLTFVLWLEDNDYIILNPKKRVSSAKTNEIY